MPHAPDGWKDGIVLGTDFITNVLLVLVHVPTPLTLRADFDATEVALRTVGDALSKGACNVLGLEPGELQAEFQPALTPAGREGLEAEIFLYNTLAGGAGFARQAGHRFREVFETALEDGMSALNCSNICRPVSSRSLTRCGSPERRTGSGMTCAGNWMARPRSSVPR